MRLSEYLEPDLVLLGLRTEGIADSLEAVVDRLKQAGALDDAGQVLDALLQRESAHSTSLANGVALPHATVPGVDRPVLAVALAPEGVPFGPEGEALVRLFFVLLSPEQEAGTHIKLLARIVRLARRPGFVASLLEVETGQELVETVERMDALHV